MNKTVYILRGASGSGKSTYTKKIAENLVDYTVVSADHFFEKNGSYEFKASDLGTAHATCMKKFVTAVLDGVDTIIVDNTNTKLYEISPYRQVALAYGYQVKIVRLFCGPTLAHQRNIHGVPKQTVEAQTDRMDKLPRFWEKEEIIYT